MLSCTEIKGHTSSPMGWWFVLLLLLFLHISKSIICIRHPHLEEGRPWSYLFRKHSLYLSQHTAPDADQMLHIKRLVPIFAETVVGHKH